jgi:hypothetical protein
MATITFNGQEFASPETMPPEMRRLCELAEAITPRHGSALPVRLQLLLGHDAPGLPGLVV